MSLLDEYASQSTPKEEFGAGGSSATGCLKVALGLMLFLFGVIFLIVGLFAGPFGFIPAAACFVAAVFVGAMPTNTFAFIALAVFILAVGYAYGLLDLVMHAAASR